MLNQSKNCYSQCGIALLVLLVFAMILFALASYFSQPDIAGTYLNPDLNTLTYMAYNVMYEHGQFFAWHIGTSPAFFPEMAVMFFITLFSKNPFINLIIYAVFQITCITILIPAIFKAATNTTAGLRLGIISVFTFLATVIFERSFAPYSEYEYLSTLLSPGFHYGPVLVIFALIFIFLKMLVSSKIYLRVLFFILLVLSGISDPLTYVYFTFPMVVTLTIFCFCKQLSKKDFLIYSALLVLGFLSAYAICHLMPLQNVPLSFKPTFSFLLVLDFLKTIVLFLKNNVLWGVLWVSFMLYTPYSMWQSFKTKSIQLVDYVILLQFITVIVSTPMIILAVNQTFPSALQIFPSVSFWSHPGQFYRELAYLPYRYFINFFVGPVFLGFPLLFYKHYRTAVEKLGNNAIYVVILLLFAFVIFTMRSHHFHKKTFTQFQSNIAVCLANYAKTYHLTNGISDSYYVTNMVNSYLAGVLHIALVDSYHLTVIRWQNTQELYQYHNYNFAISNSDAMPAALRKTYGAPIRTLMCTGNYNDQFKVYIYPNGKLNNMFNSYLATQP